LSWLHDWEIHQILEAEYGEGDIGEEVPRLHILPGSPHGLTVPNAANKTYFAITPEFVPNPFATDVTFEVDSVVDMYYQEGEAYAGHTNLTDTNGGMITRRAFAATMPHDGLVKSMSVWHAGDSGNIQAIYGLYDDASGQPGTRLAVYTAMTSPTGPGEWVTAVFASPVSVAADTLLWMGMVHSTSVSTWQNQDASKAGLKCLTLQDFNIADGMPGSFGSNITIQDTVVPCYYTYQPSDLNAVHPDWTLATSFSVIEDRSLKNTPRVVFPFGMSLAPALSAYSAPANSFLHIVTKEGWLINGVSYPSHHFTLGANE